MKATEFTISLKPRAIKYFPKKMLKTRKIDNISFKTFFSLWIPDTPDSPLQPLITLSIKTATSKFSIQFLNVKELLLWLSELELFIYENYKDLDDRLFEAIQEWSTAHEIKNIRLRKKIISSFETDKLLYNSYNKEGTGENEGKNIIAKEKVDKNF